VKKKPTCEELKGYLAKGMSLRKISDITEYSVPYLSDMCKNTCSLTVPSIGRPKGYSMSEESRAKISESNRKS
jgi:DNA-binding transcriptional MocR family regulator